MPYVNSWSHRNNIRQAFLDRADKDSDLDGVSIYAEEFFFNVRKSNTEPSIKLTLEGTTQEVIDTIRKVVESIISSEK